MADGRSKEFNRKLRQHVETGTRQLREGKFTEYDDRGLLKFRDQIKLEGRRRRKPTSE